MDSSRWTSAIGDFLFPHSFARFKPLGFPVATAVVAVAVLQGLSPVFLDALAVRQPHDHFALLQALRHDVWGAVRHLGVAFEDVWIRLSRGHEFRASSFSGTGAVLPHDVALVAVVACASRSDRQVVATSLASAARTDDTLRAVTKQLAHLFHRHHSPQMMQLSNPIVLSGSDLLPADAAFLESLLYVSTATRFDDVAAFSGSGGGGGADGTRALIYGRAASTASNDSGGGGGGADGLLMPAARPRGAVQIQLGMSDVADYLRPPPPFARLPSPPRFEVESDRTYAVAPRAQAPPSRAAPSTLNIDAPVRPLVAPSRPLAQSTFASPGPSGRRRGDGGGGDDASQPQTPRIVIRSAAPFAAVATPVSAFSDARQYGVGVGVGPAHFAPDKIRVTTARLPPRQLHERVQHRRFDDYPREAAATPPSTPHRHPPRSPSMSVPSFARAGPPRERDFGNSDDNDDDEDDSDGNDNGGGGTIHVTGATAIGGGGGVGALPRRQVVVPPPPPTTRAPVGAGGAESSGRASQGTPLRRWEARGATAPPPPPPSTPGSRPGSQRDLSYR